MSAPPAATLAGWLYVPLSAIGSRQSLDRLRADLTFTPRFAETTAEVIRMYTLGLDGHVGVPREWGRQRFGHLPIRDQTTLGGEFVAPKRPDPNHPAVLDPEAQRRFMADMLEAARTFRSFVAVAPTGSGKTTVALYTAAELGRTTLILVHLERLMEQWIAEIQDKLGVPRDRIGIIQGDCCQADRPICVGMLQSLVQRRYDRGVYRAFGTLIVDECHKIGSKAFSRVVPQFAARYRIGLSATP
ncbi:MAG: DEAD/DEAH box helicase family protein, partial [Elioraea sp.]|nr:DEAD/DEAH box helicase family protein [Elioraea sp.]